MPELTPDQLQRMIADLAAAKSRAELEAGEFRVRLEDALRDLEDARARIDELEAPGRDVTVEGEAAGA